MCDVTVQFNSQPHITVQITFSLVPEGYQFPKKALWDTGWELWLRGQPNLEICCPRSGQVKKTPIKPFHLLKPSRLPGPLKKKFQLEWKPIFAMMEETPDLMIPSGSSPLSPEFIRESFDKGTAYLKSRASYIWTLKKIKG